MFGTNRRGAGLTKEQAAQRNYLDILGRHFWHIVGASFWLTLSNILFYGATIYLCLVYFSGDNLVQLASAFLYGKPLILPIVPFLPMMLTGPFTAGFTYVIRNYAKQTPTFLIYDFFKNAKKNIRQSLAASVLITLAYYLLAQALFFYNSFFMQNGLPLGVLYTLTAVVAILLTIMVFYIYPIMVTFRMSFKVILKNAWTFTVMKLPQNFIIFVFLFAINGAVFYFLISKWFWGVWLFLLAFLLSGFTAFTANYYIWNVLNKYIVKLVTKKSEEERIFVDEEHMEYDENDDDDSYETYPEDYDATI